MAQARGAKCAGRMPQHNARLGRGLLGAGLTALCTLGCAGDAPHRPPELARREEAWSQAQRERIARLERALESLADPAASDALVVRLVFDAGADLDLFVTDPSQESVYFGNSPARSGARLLGDRRCEDPSPRVEEVQQPAPEPGRYRVSVDFPRSCEGAGLSRREARVAVFVVEARHAAHTWRQAGRVRAGEFDAIVLEFELDAEPDDGDGARR